MRRGGSAPARCRRTWRPSLRHRSPVRGFTRLRGHRHGDARLPIRIGRDIYARLGQSELASSPRSPGSCAASLTLACRRTGRRIVASRENDLWVYDLARDALSQLTFQGGSIPLWTPDGREVIYGRARPGTGWDIFRKPADGSGAEQELVARPLDQVPSGGNPSMDGQLLPFAEWSLDAAADIHLLSMKDGADRVFREEP